VKECPAAPLAEQLIIPVFIMPAGLIVTEIGQETLELLFVR